MKNTCRFGGAILTGLTLVAIIVSRLGAAEAAFLAVPDTGAVHVTLNDDAYLEAEAVAWGPKFQPYIRFKGKMTADNGATLHDLTGGGAGGAQLSLKARVAKEGPRRIVATYELGADKDTTLTYAVIGLSAGGAFDNGGKVLVTGADGSQTEVALPLGRKKVGKDVKQMIYVDAAGRRSTVTLDPPCEIHADGAARVILAKDDFKASDKAKVTLTLDLPGDVTYYASLQDAPSIEGWERWFAWQPKQNYEQPSVIGMEDWSPEPAGARGRVTRQNGDLLYGGKPVKFWGINLCYGTCAPDKKLADQRALLYRKYGVNSVRLHKWADGPGWAGIQSADSAAQFDPEGLDRMDYQIAQFKKAGIFTKLSAQFGTVKAGPADKAVIPYVEEFGTFKGKNARIATPHSGFPYSREIQDLHIKQTLNLLKHKNPYTGMTYAEDPAILVIEIINEQSILFYTSMNPLKASETLRRTTGKRFCDWLRKRYGSKESFMKAWGEASLDCFAGEGFPKGEDLDKDNILPLGNPWYWDPANLETSQKARRRRLLDSLEFLYELQVEAYQRWVQAVRDAGYQGEILASNWQAGSNTSHYYNLHSDYLVGLIDRHNYFSGDNSMLAAPGSGMLSSGMQQVADRPFMLSEWIHVFPNEWGVEGPAIIGAYGLGLQDWDVSYLFQNRDNGGFVEALGNDKWEVTAPQILGVFPAVARQVRRADVRPADVTAPRYVHVPSLRDAKLGFLDRTAQDYDVKSFDSDKVPARSLAVAKCVVEFTDEYRDTPVFDINKYLQDGAYVSSTRQLRWTPGQSPLDGYFTMDTPATKAVVGFAQDKTCVLGKMTLTPRSRFAALYVTAREPDKDLDASKSLLVTAIARARNTDMKRVGDKRLLVKGQKPVRMEPVVAEIKLARPGATVHVLDQDGIRTGQTIPVSGGAFAIDTAAHKTPYFEIAFE